MPPIWYARHQFPPEVVRHAAWLHLRFARSCRDVEDPPAERGLAASCETVRRRVLRFGPAIAGRLRRRRPKPSPRWRLDEVAARVAGGRTCLWRAADDEGEVLDVLVRRRRDEAAARRLTRRPLGKRGFAPAEIATGGLRSHGAAFAGLGLTARHERGPRKDNRAEASHQPARRRERRMRRFRSPGPAQRLVSMHSAAYDASNVQRHLVSRRALRILRADAMAHRRAAAAAA